MAWYHLTHKETGDEQFVQSLEGIDQDANTVKKISRPPTEFDRMDNGRLKHDAEEQTYRQAESMTMAERIEWLEARLAFLEEELLAK